MSTLSKTIAISTGIWLPARVDLQHLACLAQSIHYKSANSHLIPWLYHQTPKLDDLVPTPGVPYVIEADTLDEKFHERLQSRFGYTSEEVESLVNRNTADGERRQKTERIIEEPRETGQQAEKGTGEGEDIEVLSESDKAESIVDAMLARYT